MSKISRISYIEGEPAVSAVAVAPDATKPSLIQRLKNEDTLIHEGVVTYDIRFSALLPNAKIGLVL